jgi:hypothetical protein
MIGFRPDERSVMTYVAAYYHAFAGMGKAEEAARRVEAVLQMDKEFQQMIHEYETRASSVCLMRGHIHSFVVVFSPPPYRSSKS